jgi:hypothetical protein
MYEYMTGGMYPSELIKPDQPQTQLSDVQMLYTFGPFPELKPGASLRVLIALVTGYCMEECPGSLKENARFVLVGSDGPAPYQPPPPIVTLTPGLKRVRLDWGSLPVEADPRNAWDDSSKVAETAYSDTSWRRVNPPAGHYRGGRIFEGYRLYRSEEPWRGQASFTLLRQWDLPGDAFGINNGIDTVFIDSNLTIGKTYGYAVTTLGIPNMTILEFPDSSGSLRYDTIMTDMTETPIWRSEKFYTQGFVPSQKLGEVLVVPNPYRGDVYYTDGNGFEGRESEWTLYKRQIKFIHLPAQATIRVYTVSGDVIATINHDETRPGSKSGEESWLLFSESGRELASGLYVFSVESGYGRQVGKFVIMK